MKPRLAIYMQSRETEKTSTGMIHRVTGEVVIGQKVADRECLRMLCCKKRFVHKHNANKTDAEDPVRARQLLSKVKQMLITPELGSTSPAGCSSVWLPAIGSLCKHVKNITVTFRYAFIIAYV